ncbi:MAG: hypothetical protein DLM67_08705 [Candidatus Nephthysia bennettiae]|uniref:Uncharacterized protein n=1 Tax=Candidatus Nephthysia bennettiae TaxID=3127016 RepID=A0A934K3L9_9BACT|nr:hypothetical protein [Candidatus Dormibacteraeota bacterium]MBJ7612512.1 hypothetical protein [Candidatus Dormibacteraeota bacterium]PZR97131.1 MAG: hypothetical protein DLM67_08705 [Candidatus Dormibacteraeota bacterium]
MSESDYRKAVEETQQETSTSDTPDATTAPERRGEEEGEGDEEDEPEPALREGSEEAATGRPGEDRHFHDTVEEAARRDAGAEDTGELTPGSSPVSSSGGGEPATSERDEVPARS